MKKILLLLLTSLTVLLGACSAEEVTTKINDVKEKTGINYATGVLDYLNDVQVFVDTIPGLTAQATKDEASRENLKSTLLEMKSDIQDFNSLTPPPIASVEENHQKVVEFNQKFESGIDMYIEIIEKGSEIPTNILETTGILTSLQPILDLLNEIKQLTK